MDALYALGLNPVVSVGDTTETVEVTAAPPVLETTNAQVGLVMENQTYSNLPLQMNNAQRDATAFASLAPGAQAGTRVPIMPTWGGLLGRRFRYGTSAGPLATVVGGGTGDAAGTARPSCASESRRMRST